MFVRSTFLLKIAAAVGLTCFLAWSLGHREPRQTPQLQFELVSLFSQNNVIGHVNDFNDLQEAVKKLDEVDLNGLLYQAAEAGASLPAMKWIVAKGAKPQKIRPIHDLTFFEQLAKTPNLATFDYFIGLGLSPTERGRDGSTVLHYAARGGLDPKILNLLLSKGSKLTDQDELGRLPIHWANVNSINVLVSAGADVDAKDGLGRTALMLAEKDNRNDLAQELIHNQASVFAKDEHGRTPLHYAAMSNNPGQLIDTLLAAGAAVTARDDDGYTAKELAVRSRDMFKNRSRGWYDKL